jgi:hypothetical protein
MPVQRIEMTTQDMDVIADLMNERYAEHRARFWCYDPGRVRRAPRALEAVEKVVTARKGHGCAVPLDALHMGSA